MDKILTPEQVDELASNVRGAHWVNLLVRRNGQAHYYQADYLQHIKPSIEALREQLARALGTTYCAYCGADFALDAPDATTLVTEHIYTCPKHPMRNVEAQLAEAQADARALANRLQLLHEQVDEANCKLGDNRRLCLLCLSKGYGPDGIIHQPNCSLPMVRNTLARPAVQRAMKEGDAKAY